MSDENTVIDLDNQQSLTALTLTLGSQSISSTESSAITENSVDQASADKEETIESILDKPSPEQTRSLKVHEKLLVTLRRESAANYTSVEKNYIDLSKSKKTEYYRKNMALETRFFKTLTDAGGALGKLSISAEDGINMKNECYILTRGTKDPAKKQIINDCLNLCALRWKNTKKGKKLGDVLDSNTFAQHMK